MKETFKKIKEKIMGEEGYDYDDYSEEDYLEIDTDKNAVKKQKVIVRPYTIEDFSDIKATLDALRDGYTIALVNIKPLKDKDIVELKRAVNKLKKTCEAIEGDIAGFGEDWIVVTPSFAQIHRNQGTEEVDG
ncbi:MAG: cell division protein SepF [Nanoarchaeota archaeon]